MPTQFTTQEKERIKQQNKIKVKFKNPHSIAHSGKPQNILFSSALFDKFFSNNKRRWESAKNTFFREKDRKVRDIPVFSLFFCSFCFRMIKKEMNCSKTTTSVKYWRLCNMLRSLWFYFWWTFQKFTSRRNIQQDGFELNVIGPFTYVCLGNSLINT